MLGTLRSYWQALQSLFWLFPAVIAAVFVALTFLLVEIDRTSGPNGIDWAFSGDAEAARGILSTIAGSLITVAGLSFSITIVTLQLVSGQYTPRAVRGFLNDRVNQAVAGAFVGIFAYCLMTLRVIRAEDTDGTNGFVPALTVSAAIVLALIALGLLLLFIHHMGQLIQVSNITARIGRQTLASVGRLYPKDFGERANDTPPERLLADWRSEGDPDRVHADRPGFVRRIDKDRVGAALPDEVRTHVAVRPGDFVTETVVAVEVWPAGSLDEESVEALRRAVEIESERDLEQDVGFGIRQLADIALRALSPGINDPTTAVTCIGYLQAIVERLAGRDFPSRTRRLPDREVVVVSASTPFEEYAQIAFAEVGRYAASDVRVAAALLVALAEIAETARAADAPERAEAVVALAREAAELARAEAGTDAERARIDDLVETVAAA